LQKRFGFGGIGAWNLGSDAYPLPGVTVVKSGASTTKLDLTGDANKSFIGHALQTQQGSIITINSSTAQLDYGKFNKVEIWYAQQSTAITYTVTIDGVSQANIVCTTGTGIDKVTYNTTLATHNIVITQTSTGLGSLLECNLTIANSKKLVIHREGNGGITAAQLETVSNNASYLIPSIAPTIAVIRVGANNITSTGAAASAQNVWTIANNLKQNGVKNIIVLGETDNNTTARDYVDSYNSAYQQLCDTANFAFCNLKNVARNWTDFIANGYSTIGDPVHENSTGGALFADYLIQFLTDNSYSANSISTMQGWGLTGNSATNSSTNFVGTTDAQDLLVKTNNVEALRVTTQRNIAAIGSSTGAYNPPVGVKMVYYPQQGGAMRTGSTSSTQWNSDSVGVSSFAAGVSTIAKDYSFALGFETESRGNYSFSSGYRSKALGGYSFSVGNQNHSYSDNTFTQGFSNIASAAFAIAQGDRNKSIGYASFSQGLLNNNQADYGFSSGYGNTMNAQNNYAIGENNVVTGRYAGTLGRNLRAKAYASISVGQFNDTLDAPIFNVPLASDRVFQVGKGTSDANRDNALTIFRNGQTAINTTNPAASAVLDVTSTTGGILFPRMTITQRDAVASPANGLMIFCTDCGTGKFQGRAAGVWVDLH